MKAIVTDRAIFKACRRLLKSGRSYATYDHYCVEIFVVRPEQARTAETIALESLRTLFGEVEHGASFFGSVALVEACYVVDPGEVEEGTFLIVRQNEGGLRGLGGERVELG